MTHPEAAQTYLLSEIDDLDAFDFLLVAPANQPLHVTEVTRTEEGNLEVRMPGRPPTVPQFDATIRRALCDLGFASSDPSRSLEPWIKPVDDAESAVEVLRKTRIDVFGAKPDVDLKLMHGSHRMEHEAEEKLGRARARIEASVSDLLGHKAELDEDGDYLVPIGEVSVTVAPRALPDGEVVTRISAITNVGVQVTPELGLFLARLNFDMMFGRFALDTEHRAIWFDETMLGEDFREEEFRFVVRMIATTADGWDDRLKKMFGGVTYKEVLAGRAAETLPPIKPGEGLGLYL